VSGLRGQVSREIPDDASFKAALDPMDAGTARWTPLQGRLWWSEVGLTGRVVGWTAGGRKRRLHRGVGPV
jgi:hypothetical protein